MRRGLKKRAVEAELMDDFNEGGLDLIEALRHLRWLNRIFGAAGPTLYGVKHVWASAGRPEHITIMDIGSGSGDVNRKLLRWASKNQIQMNIILVDITEEACEQARLMYQDDERVQVIKRNLFDLQENQADIVTATQFVHHFPSEELPQVVKKLLAVSRFGVVINDIHRHWIPWLAVWIMTHIISRNRYIRHDGPLSVAKGFRRSDWQALKQALAQPFISYSWKPLFRYVVIARKVVEPGLIHPMERS
ncbi:hypothetical protein D3C73_852930 [compost metagenome]